MAHRHHQHQQNDAQLHDDDDDDDANEDEHDEDDEHSGYKQYLSTEAISHHRRCPSSSQHSHESSFSGIFDFSPPSSPAFITCAVATLDDSHQHQTTCLADPEDLYGPATSTHTPHTTPAVVTAAAATAAAAAAGELGVHIESRSRQASILQPHNVLEVIDESDDIDLSEAPRIQLSRNSFSSDHIIRRRSSHVSSTDQHTMDSGDDTTLNKTTALAASSKPHLDDFKLLFVIGRGAYGKVFLTQKISSGDVYAMKVIKKADIVAKKVIRHAKNERSVLVAVSHPFIVQLRYAFQTPSKIYLILDFIAGGELFTRLNKVQFFMKDTACFYAAELVLALEYLHNTDILYRDLKPENVMIAADGHICLTDMGLAVHNVNSDGARSFCGTLHYMAPEVVRKSLYGKPADWWALGILLYEMLSGDVPFTGANDATVQRRILKAKLRFPAHISGASRQLLKGLLHRDVAKRLDVNAIKTHRFFINISWANLEQKIVIPPFIPQMKMNTSQFTNNHIDVSHFDTTFTGEIPVDTASESDSTPLSASLQAHFQGFSYQC